MYLMEKHIVQLSEDPYNYAKDLNVKDLEEIISYASDKFFNEESVISDAIYDLLIDFLRYKEPKNKLLKKVGSEVKSKNKIELDYYLGSMDKIKPPSNQLEKWINKYKSPYILTEKLDGVSGLLIYKKDGNIKLYTRGTATHGIDITQIVKYITKIPSFDRMEKFVKKKKLNSSKNDNLISFRGEIIISKKTFDSEWSSTKSNARNTVSGLVNSKNLDPILAGTTNFVVYEIVDPIMKLSEQLKLSNEIGFRTVHSKEFKELTYSILSEYLKKRKDKSKYLIDGIIVSNDEIHQRNKSGNPDYAFAFKDVLEDQKAKSTIVDVEWKISKDGFINPTVIIKPVEIGGVTISRITAYNAKYVVDNKIGKDTEIELIRSGDVIPKILKVIKPAKEADLPEGKWKWNDTKVDIISLETNSKEIDIKNIHFFFSSLDTKGLGEKVVEKIYNSGLKTIKDFVNATKEELLQVDGIKEKSADNLIKSINKALTNNSSGIELYVLMAASNQLGHGMGKERCKLVLEKYPDLLTEYKKWKKEEFVNKIKEIPGWEEKTSQQFVNNFSKFIIFYESIKDKVKIKDSVKTKKKKNSELNGKTLVLSGFRDKDLEKLLEDYDVKISNSVSKNTDYLVVKDQSVINEKTGKVKKAEELSINIITKNELENKLSK